MSRKLIEGWRNEMIDLYCEDKKKIPEKFVAIHHLIEKSLQAQTELSFRAGVEAAIENTLSVMNMDEDFNTHYRDGFNIAKEAILDKLSSLKQEP